MVSSNIKTKIFFILLFVITIINSNAQENINKDLSFLIGQKNIKFEFVYDSLTIDGVLEDSYLKKNYDESFVTYWNKEKSTNIPESFINNFNNYFKKIDFKGSLVSNESQYLCIVHILSIKSGITNLITPTLWVSYTFYESSKRDNPLAFFKSHVAFAKGGTYYRRNGDIITMATGRWDQAYSAFYKEGKKIAKEVKKGARLKK